jgi:hypothetical protein
MMPEHPPYQHPVRRMVAQEKGSGNAMTLICPWTEHFENFVSQAVPDYAFADVMNKSQQQKLRANIVAVTAFIDRHKNSQNMCLFRILKLVQLSPERQRKTCNAFGPFAGIIARPKNLPELP